MYVIPRWAQIDYGLAERNLDNCIKGLAIKRERERAVHTQLYEVYVCVYSRRRSAAAVRTKGRSLHNGIDNSVRGLLEVY